MLNLKICQQLKRTMLFILVNLITELKTTKKCESSEIKLIEDKKFNLGAKGETLYNL
jgi:hypothetical protein